MEDVVFLTTKNAMSTEEKPNVPWWQGGMQIFLKLSVWIGGPALAGVLLGKYLDQKYHTQPWLLIICAATAFVVSMMMLIKVGKEEMGKAEKSKK